MLINIIHIASEFNASDILSKNWKYQASYDNILKPFLHHKGNIGNLYINNKTDFQYLIMKQLQVYEQVVVSSMTWDTVLNVTVDEQEDIMLQNIQVGNYQERKISYACSLFWLHYLFHIIHIRIFLFMLIN